MAAKKITGQTPGGARVWLADVLPLATPFVVQIFPVYGCNFACRYCIFSVPREKRGYISDKRFMDFSLYKNCIDDMSGFQDKVKMLRFAAIGEPLLHKNIVDMVAYAVSKNIANSVDIVTNGVLLTPELSKGLVEAKLTRLRVSVQGVTAARYKEISDVDINFEVFVENLRYFYEHKGKTQVYIKIIDCAIKNNKEEDHFYDIFGRLCDVIAIEHLTPTAPGVDYEIFTSEHAPSLTQCGHALVDAQICPTPFYMMQINPDGKVVPCCAVEYPGIFGDTNTQSVIDIWNGEKLHRFRRKMLNGVKNVGEVCSRCSLYKYGICPEDVLDGEKEKLIKLYE